uniref:Potassium channel domain-containing protein n=1 Tax=Panagrolaimus sp. PS1159 TaxID=55785 RepID=A0AC35FVR2_9BILA
MDTNEFSDEDFINALKFSLTLNLSKIFIGFMSFVISAIIFQISDDLLAKKSFSEILLFSFTTVTTIGLGTLVPTSEAGMIFCIFYICFGVPIILSMLNGFGEMLAELFWIFVSAAQGKMEILNEKQIPITITMFLMIGYSVVGALICICFITITTIGFGDISPDPQTILESIIFINYISFGIVIFSAFMNSLTAFFNHFYNNEKSIKNAKVKFGNKKFTVVELVEIVRAELNGTERQLENVLKNLDKLIDADKTQSKNHALNEINQWIHTTQIAPRILMTKTTKSPPRTHAPSTLQTIYSDPIKSTPPPSSSSFPPIASTPVQQQQISYPCFLDEYQPSKPNSYFEFIKNIGCYPQFGEETNDFKLENMAKMRYTFGFGLGKNGQGMRSALKIEKKGEEAGKIIREIVSSLLGISDLKCHFLSSLGIKIIRSNLAGKCLGNLQLFAGKFYSTVFFLKT